MRNVSVFSWVYFPQKLWGVILFLLFVLRLLLTMSPASEIPRSPIRNPQSQPQHRPRNSTTSVPARGAQTLPLAKFHLQTFWKRLQIECLIAVAFWKAAAYAVGRISVGFHKIIFMNLSVLLINQSTFETPD